MAQTKKKKIAAKSSAKAPAKKVTAKKPAPKKVAAKTASAKKPAKKTVDKAVAFVKKIAKKAQDAVSSAQSAVSPAKKAATLIPNSFQPLDDRIIISIEPMAEKTAGGIFIPDTATERPSRGTVLAIGPGKRNKKGVVRPLDVIVGDTVLFPQFAGQKIEIGANEFLILREEEILGITT